MSDDRADLILNMLRGIRAEQSTHRDKLGEIIVRLGRLEREIAGLHADYAGLSIRLDNLDRRVGRIEHRLGWLTRRHRTNRLSSPRGDQQEGRPLALARPFRVRGDLLGRGSPFLKTAQG